MKLEIEIYGRPKPLTPKAGSTKNPSRRYGCGGKVRTGKK